MARKSRKETAAVAVQEADAACRAAIYVRLSVEDTHTHSVSIETQQMIIARYLEQYPETPSTPATTSSSISASAASALLRSMKISTPPPLRTPIPVSSSRCGT